MFLLIKRTNCEDGNANVQTYIYNNPSWDSSGAGMTISMSGILTDEVLQNDAVLTYVKHTARQTTNIIPGLVWNEFYRNYSVFLEGDWLNPEELMIVSLEVNGDFTPNADLWAVDWVKVIIIGSTNTTTQGVIQQKKFIMN